MSIARYRKNPVDVRAVRWTGDNLAEVKELSGDDFARVTPGDHPGGPDITAEVFDKLHCTWIGVYIGQWIIEGTRGEFYPCADEVFQEVYEEASEDWEYGVEWSWPRTGEHDTEWWGSRSEAELNMRPAFEWETVRLVRRRPAGPMEEVPA